MTRRSASERGVARDGSRSRLENGPTLDRVTFRATDEQLAAIESLVEDDVYHSRSEAIRAGIRELLDRHARSDGESEPS